MDDSVLAAIAKWPNVPAVFGWLRLTVRGQWRIRNEPIDNAAIRDFIGRNYAPDERGRWFFQNGPQRVYVTLDATPWIWRVSLGAGVWELRAHTGAAPQRLRGAWLDEAGRLFALTDLGFGLVDSADAVRAVACLGKRDHGPVEDEEFESWLAGRGPEIFLYGPQLALTGAVPLERLRAAQAPARFGYVRDPQP